MIFHDINDSMQAPLEVASRFFKTEFSIYRKSSPASLANPPQLACKSLIVQPLTNNYPFCRKNPAPSLDTIIFSITVSFKKKSLSIPTYAIPALVPD